MSQGLDIEALIRLRKQTRAISDALRSQAADYLATLAMLVRPQHLFGEYLQGAPRSSGRETQHHFKEFKELYDRIGSAAPFSLIHELEVPLNLLNTTPELYALEYDLPLAGRTVRVTSPTRWVVGFQSFELERFRKVIKDPNRSNAELYRFVIHYLVLFYCFSKSGGLGRLLLGLRFPVSFERLKEFGDLPFCVISSPVRSSLPDESVIRSATEISGNATFEELVSREDILGMQDDIRQRLLQTVEGL
ncbi:MULTISPECIES: hypothetical protein [Pseudomonas]|uniref:Uncharacterized protein n=1 Tax=Pseudomonas delhiensis TaxID=366289 RepID=A0A239N4Q6_9PSED|nr:MULTISPECIES: hypothetical protein [Pseudomonas]MED5611469.1 hypothetical protein [Pseudomonas sp. JH-2]GLU39995.1 hypothetical protein Pssp01_40880 [Pseudomonas sp. NBRC 100443]SDK88967.1 hypothetical protein SAMN05216189_105619 [Pseudomonas delhiensis]SNT49444.1 hypothetical protein SAMN06295949_13624 [Pseudomonas delhiensis]